MKSSRSIRYRVLWGWADWPTRGGEHKTCRAELESWYWHRMATESEMMFIVWFVGYRQYRICQGWFLGRLLRKKSGKPGRRSCGFDDRRVYGWIDYISTWIRSAALLRHCVLNSYRMNIRRQRRLYLDSLRRTRRYFQLHGGFCGDFRFITSLLHMYILVWSLWIIFRYWITWDHYEVQKESASESEYQVFDFLSFWPYKVAMASATPSWVSPSTRTELIENLVSGVGK